VLGDYPAMKLAKTPIKRTLWPDTAPAEMRRFNRFLVTADFERTDGRTWSSVGGGETVNEALEAARADLGPEWEIVRWNHAYGG
jgi:hypothetical protein